MEVIPKYPINSRSRNRTYIELGIWFYRFVIGLSIILLSHTLLVEVNRLGIMGAILGISEVTVIVILSYSIWSDNKTLKGIMPMEIFEHGLVIPTVIEDRIRGIQSPVVSTDIESLEIKRRAGYQLTDGGKVAWLDAPIEFMILFKNGKKYNSGQKLPIEVLKMTEIMWERWHLPIVDKGSGIGKVVESHSASF